jgi:hypothetical protein
VEEGVDWNEEEIMKEKPEWIEDRYIERNLKLCSEREKKDMLENAKEFINWMEDELEKHKTKVIDLKQKWVWRECDDFNEEYGTTTQEVEESYYLYRKIEYEKWSKRYEEWRNKKEKAKEKVLNSQATKPRYQLHQPRYKNQNQSRKKKTNMPPHETLAKIIY